MKYLLISALFIGSANAFVPTTPRQTVISAEQSATSLGPGFLKDLGFEKPSWLPDFGAKKEEEVVAVASGEEVEGAEEDAEEAPAEEVSP
jgi:hypothetical protein